MQSGTNPGTPQQKPYYNVVHHRMQVYGLWVSVIGLPVGLLLGMPIVWGLASAGIAVSLFKLWNHQYPR